MIIIAKAFWMRWMACFRASGIGSERQASHPARWQSLEFFNPDPPKFELLDIRGA